MAQYKTCRPCFSCGREAEWWLETNCDRCVKSSHLKIGTNDEYTKSRCSIYDDIMTQYMGYGNEPIASRSYDATQGRTCPYIRTEWPPTKKRGKKDKSLKLEFKD